MYKSVTITNLLLAQKNSHSAIFLQLYTKFRVLHLHNFFAVIKYKTYFEKGDIYLHNTFSGNVLHETKFDIEKRTF